MTGLKVIDQQFVFQFKKPKNIDYNLVKTYLSQQLVIRTKNGKNYKYIMALAIIRAQTNENYELTNKHK